MEMASLLVLCYEKLGAKGKEKDDGAKRAVEVAQVRRWEEEEEDEKEGVADGGH